MDLSCIITTILFEIANALQFAFLRQYQNRAHFDYDAFTSFDIEYIQNEWNFRRNHRALDITGGILNAMAWFLLMIPILQVSWLLSYGGSRQLAIHLSIAIIAVGGSLTEWIANLLEIGTSTVGYWISSGSFNMNWISNSTSNNNINNNGDDGIGWRTLEMSYTLIQGGLLWIDAFESLAIFFITLLLHISIASAATSSSSSSSSRPVLFSSRWSLFGLVLGSLSIVDFAANCLRLKSWMTFSDISLAISITNRLFVLPIWILWMGYQIPTAHAMSQTHTRKNEESVRISNDERENNEMT
jgi:hypothetical protein